MKGPRKPADDANAIAAATAKPAPQTNAAGEGGEKAANEGDAATAPVSGLTPTSNPVRNAYGLELDRFGLPVNGPARSAVLAMMETPDPALEPGDWDFRDGERAAEVMEKIYG